MTDSLTHATAAPAQPKANVLLAPLVVVVVAGGAALEILGIFRAGNLDWMPAVVLAALAFSAERVNVRIYGGARLSIAFVPIFAALILFGLAGIALVAPFSTLSTALQVKRPLHKTAFNAGALLISAAAALPLYDALRPAGGIDNWPAVMVPVTVAAAVSFFVNSALVAAAVSFSSRTNSIKTWTEHFGWLGPHYIVMGLLGLATATAYVLMGIWGMAVFLGPALTMLFSFKQYVDKTTGSVMQIRKAHAELEEAHHATTDAMAQLGRAYEGTLRSLAAALDARDSETGGHSERVAELTMAVATEMGLQQDSDEWRSLERGALLHDVGKIAVPDHILRKPERLSEDEWQSMREHPRAGFEILQSVDFLRDAASLVLAHHESFDGTGYPNGLMGEEIPLGARIFAVVDAFDAMTQDRPYRKGIVPSEALAEILECSGTQFDPEVVSAFLAVYRKKFVQGRNPLPKLRQTVRQAILEAAGLDE